MAVGTGVTEIADSEEELLTSSPPFVSDEALDKLFATACHAVACPHQEPATRTANAISNHVDSLGADQETTSPEPPTARANNVHLQSAQASSIDTNDSICAAEDQVKTDILRSQVGSIGSTSEQQVVDAAGQNSKNGLHERGNPIPPGNAIQQDECLLHLAYNFGRNEESQPNSPAYVHPDSDRINIEPFYISNKRLPYFTSQEEERVDCSSTGDHMHNDLGTISCDQEATSEYGVAVEQDVTDQEDVDPDVSKREPQCGIVVEAAVEPLKATTTTHSDTVLEANRTRDLAADFSDDLPRVGVPTDFQAASLNTHPGLTTNDAIVTVPRDHDDGNTDEGLEYEHVAGRIIPTASLDNKVASPITDQSTNNDEDPRRFSQVDRISAIVDEFSDGPRSSKTGKIGDSTEDKTTDAGTLGHVLAVSSLGKVTEDFRSRRVDHNMTEQVPETPFLRADEVVEPHKTGPSNNQVDSSAASAATAMQSKSQSTPSQANEDNSPRPASCLTPQEATLAELKTQKATLLASLVALPAIQILIEEGQSCDVDVSDDDGEPTHADIMAAANTVVKEHIKLLHEYNELKDVGQGLMGLIADQRGVRIVEVQDEFGINAND